MVSGGGYVVGAGTKLLLPSSSYATRNSDTGTRGSGFPFWSKTVPLTTPARVIVSSTISNDSPDESCTQVPGSVEDSRRDGTKPSRLGTSRYRLGASTGTVNLPEESVVRTLLPGFTCTCTFARP